MINKSLIIFVRRPELGKVKTRIAASVGPVKALAIYKELLLYTRKVAESCDVQRQLFYTNEIDTNDQWSSQLFQKHVQSTGDLGQKMHQAFEQCFLTSDQVVIIGSDCASLTKEIVEQAFTALEQHDVAIGPTFDGGYYLLGMNSPRAELFENIKWSTEAVFEQTIENIKKSGLTYAVLTKLSDIDYIEDWEEFGSSGVRD